MKKLTLILSWMAFLWLISPARAQVGQETLIPGTPPGGIGGACLISSFGYLVPVTQGSEIVLCDPTSHLWTVTSGGGSGSCGALAGDVTGTCAANVVGKITGTLASNVLFVDATYDIGATGATRPRNLFLSSAMTSVSAKLTGLAGGGTQCVTVDNTGALGATGAACGSGNGSVQGTISGTSIAITHASTSILNFTCFTSGGIWLEPNTVTQTSATVLTLAFLSDQTGSTCNVFTQGSIASGGVSSVSGTPPIASSGGTSPVISISNFTGDSGSGGAAGAVPAPAAGDAAASKYLKANGTWATVATTGTSTVLIVTSHGNHSSSGSIAGEYFSSCDATAGQVNLTLGSSPTTGTVVNIKRKDASANLCVIDGNGKSIDGGTNVPISTQYGSISLYYDGTQWWVI